ncbi:hypothetical protein [Pseudomonas sp. Irchel s3h14]|jgi:hypothetical protein|uniref:hypothetical protein n=1 Tax=Pseudomonas sp. Irchel s3h14 TaxID=2009179 RepID=UPI000BA2C2BB|nr:hypothetical protein [Pseudomonas sp. Irchel s3h14]
MEFSTTLWEWYGQDEYKRVLAVCEAIPGLTFLAMNADAQRDAIPYCPACEAWSETMLPLNEALTVCGAAMPCEVRTGLQQVWDLCNSLPETAFHCDDWWIFDQYEWQPLREAAEQALDLVEAVKIAPYLDELILDCRNAVRGLKRQ